MEIVTAAERSRLGHDLGLGLVVLGVEDAALHAGLLECGSQLFRLDDACGADQYRPTRTLNSGNLGHESLLFRRAVGKDESSSSRRRHGAWVGITTTSSP